MFASFLIGLVGGQRAFTPLATVAVAAFKREIPSESGPARILRNPLIAGGAMLAATAEMAGDKQKTAPDRIRPAGLGVRFVTSAIAGAALAPKSQRLGGAVVGGATAVAACFLGWRARTAAMERYGQTASGFIEDAAVISGAAAVARARKTRAIV